ncbi:MAG: hypothetical protein ACKO9Z_11745, partial [Planctomycetota bacterium]
GLSKRQVHRKGVAGYLPRNRGEGKGLSKFKKTPADWRRRLDNKMTDFSGLEPAKQQPVEQGRRRSGMGKEPPTGFGGPITRCPISRGLNRENNNLSNRVGFDLGWAKTRRRQSEAR